jgi:hypothetical protein
VAPDRWARYLYGLDCLLTEDSLFTNGGVVKLFAPVHFVNSASVADVSALVLHYKFAGNALEVAAQNKSVSSVDQAGHQAKMPSFEA